MALNEAPKRPFLNSMGRAFGSLASRPYRCYFMSGMGLTAAQGFEQLALSWVVLDLTGSLAKFGLVIFVRGIPMALLGIFGGVIGDRYDRRKALMLNQALSSLNMVVLSSLVIAGRAEVWHVLVSSVVLGVSSSLSGPSRQAMIRGLVSDEHLVNAVTLNAIQLQASRILWPSLAGALIAAAGSGGALLACAGGYLVGFIFLIPVADVSFQRPGRGTSSPLNDLVEGLRYTFTTPLVAMVMTLALSMFTFGLTFRQLAPAFGRQVLNFDQVETGLLITATGVGALVGSAILLIFNFRKPAAVLAYLCVGLGLSLVLISVNRYYLPAFVLMGFFGLCNTTGSVVVQTVLQVSVPQCYLSRVSSIYMLSPGLAALLTYPIGVLSDAVGLRLAIAGLAVIVLVVSLVLGIGRLPRLERQMAPEAG